MVSKKVSILTVVFVLGLTLSASAGFVFVQQVPNGGAATHASLANTTTNDILVNDQGDGIATHQMRMVLTSGNIVEQGGGNTPPSQTDIDDIPRRRWDSFVAGGFATAEEGPPPTPAARSSSLAFGGPGGAPPSFANTGYDVAWGVLGPISQNVTHYLSARLTLTNTANGTIGYQTVFNDGTSYCAGCQQQAPPPGNNGGGAQPLFRIVNGVIIPEPASISLASLAMFGLIGLVRRRK